VGEEEEVVATDMPTTTVTSMFPEMTSRVGAEVVLMVHQEALGYLSGIPGDLVIGFHNLAANIHIEEVSVQRRQYLPK
jgi:hypothetical protein